MLAREGAIRTGQIHTDQPHLRFSLQSLQVALQRRFRAPQHHVVHLVMAQIAKTGGIALSASEKMLIDAQYRRAARRMLLGKLALQPMLEIALDGGGPDPFPFSQPTAIDSIPVLFVDRHAKRFTRALAPQNAGQQVSRLPSALQALRFRHLQFQLTIP